MLRIFISLLLLSLPALAAKKPLVRELSPIRALRTGKAEQSVVINTLAGEQITKIQIEHRVKEEHEKMKFKHHNFKLAKSPVVPGSLLEESVIEKAGGFDSQTLEKWSPPDATLAVGPDYVVVTANMKVAFLKKSGEKVFEHWLGNQEENGFFKSIGAGDFTFDPRVLFDKVSQRFILICGDVDFDNKKAYLDLAVSDDSDPNGKWYLYRTEMVYQMGGEMAWADYPGLGVTEQGIYVSGNLFAFEGENFYGSVFRAIKLAPLLDGGTLSYVDFLDPEDSSSQPAQSETSSTYPFFVSGYNKDSLKIHSIKDIDGVPALVQMVVSVPEFSGNQEIEAPQKGGSVLQALDGRIMNVMWSKGRLVAGHAVMIPNVEHSVARWYEIQTQNWPVEGDVKVEQVGNIDLGDGNYAMFPALAINGEGDIAMVLGQTSMSEFPSILITGRRASDSQGYMGKPAMSQQGTSSWTKNSRWGDYFGAQVDPSDTNLFWAVGEYCTAPAVWNTWISYWNLAN